MIYLIHKNKWIGVYGNLDRTRHSRKKTYQIRLNFYVSIERLSKKREKKKLERSISISFDSDSK